MADIEVKLNSAGVKALLKSGEMQRCIGGYAQQVESAAGEGYAAEVKVGKNRCYATIAAQTPHAHFSNLKHNTLVKALGSAKG